jgi:hypothetical protein
LRASTAHHQKRATAQEGISPQLFGVQTAVQEKAVGPVLDEIKELRGSEGNRDLFD